MEECNKGEVNARAKAAVVGGLIADAAVNPLHWVYNQEDLGKLISDSVNSEFHEWGCPFYVDEIGSFSCYGYQAFNLLQSLIENKGLDAKQYALDIYRFFGPESFHKPNPSSKEQMPKQGPWVNGSITRSFEKLKQGDPLAGQEEHDSDGFSKVIPLIALYAGTDQLDDMIDAAVRTTLNSEQSVATAKAYGKLLEQTILKGSFNIDDWLSTITNDNVKEQVQAVLDMKNEPHVSTAKKFGIACALPGSWQNTVHALINSKDFVSAVRLALSAGGGNCARSMAVGAVFAAQGGNDAIPKEWIAKTARGQEVEQLADELIKLRK